MHLLHTVTGHPLSQSYQAILSILRLSLTLLLLQAIDGVLRLIGTAPKPTRLCSCIQSITVVLSGLGYTGSNCAVEVTLPLLSL